MLKVCLLPPPELPRSKIAPRPAATNVASVDWEATYEAT